MINALALSRVWYVASLIHMPAWVLKELSFLAFSFFWSGKRELVSHSSVSLSPLFGGFSVVNIKYKVSSLLGQWVKRLSSSSAGWISRLCFWLCYHFSASPLEVFSRPFAFNPRVLPPFYRSLLLAWRDLDGSFSSSRNSLVYGSSSCHACSPVSSMSTKICYLYLLSENMAPPHCVEKFAPTFGALHWPSTWRSLSFFDIDRHVIDLNWKIAHGVPYTAERLVRFGLSVLLPCFCGSPIESLDNFFFSCPLPQSLLSWLQSLMFNFSHMCPVILCRHALFGFNSDELRVTPRIFGYLLNVCKFVIWRSRNDFRFGDVHPDATSAIVQVKTHVKFHLPLFFRRFKSSRRQRYFHCQWGARGVVASVAAGQLTVCL